MIQTNIDGNIKAGIFGGTFFSTLSNIGTEGFIATSILAVVGATVSFFVSIVLKFVFNQFKKRFKK